ncbi:MAG: ABC transporter ATP-binding protein [Actinomycetota bacterium]|nr:ABC transporter ATP-binding protein [Actinomycetota bacterium]
MGRHAAYEVRNLRKVYRKPQVVANDGIDFVVQPGEAFGLLGSNGAGKTTLVRQLVGLLAPTSGQIRLFGDPLQGGKGGDPRVGRAVAYLPQGSLALGELKVSEAIMWTGMLRGCGRATAGSETKQLTEALDLGPLATRQLRKLSGGQRRLVQIAMTLVGRLPVLILDEPTADIDPRLRRRIWELLAERCRAGAAMILVTHDVAEAEHVLDRVAILDHGKVAAAGTPAELKSGLAHRTRIEVVLAEDGGADAASVASLLGPSAKIENRRISGWTPAEDAIAILEKVMASSGPQALEDARLVTPTLEDVYLEVSGHSLGDDEERA